MHVWDAGEISHVLGLESGAALATVVRVLTEVPFMLFLVGLCKGTAGFFRS